MYTSRPNTVESEINSARSITVVCQGKLGAGLSDVSAGQTIKVREKIYRISLEG